MTPLEISSQVGELKQKLQRLAKVKIGMSNYQDVMKEYQQLLYSLMGALEDLCEVADKAINPLASPIVDGSKETT